MSEPVPASIRRRQLLQDVLFSQGQSGDASGLETTGHARIEWAEERMRDEWIAAASDPGEDHINHVYVHVPFCKSICSFCNYKRLRPTSPALLRTWLDRVKGSLRTLEPGISKHRFHTLYLGGGTPSVLPAALIRELVQAIDDTVPFVEGGGRRSIELDPAVCSSDRIEALTDLGFTDFSFGVQALDKSVSVAHNRGPQTPELIARRVKEVLAGGAEEVGLDFLFGLDGTTPDQMLTDLDRTMTDLAPSRLNVFLLTPTIAYVDSHFGGSFDAFWKHQRGFEVATERIHGLAERHGYEVDGKGHYLMLQRRPGSFDLANRAYRTLLDRTTFALAERLERGGVGRAALQRISGLLGIESSAPQVSYTQSVAFQHRPLHLLGLGYSARSRIFGRAFVEYMDPGDDPAREGPAWYRGHTTDRASEARSYALYLLRDEREVSLERVEQLFGMSLDEAAPAAVSAWRELNLIEEENGAIQLNAVGRQQRGETLAWLFSEAAIEEEIARYRRIDLRPEKVAALVEPLKPGDPVGDDWTLARIEQAAVVVKRADREERCRISPSLTSLLGLEVVAECPDLLGVRRRLQVLVNRNGASNLGIRSRTLARTENGLTESPLETPKAG